MSKKSFLAKLCLTSFLFGGNCNANPNRMVSSVWGNNQGQKNFNNDSLPPQRNNENEPLIVNVAPVEQIKYLAITHDKIDKCTLSVDSRDYEEFSKISNFYDENQCPICNNEFDQSQETCIKLTSKSSENWFKYLMRLGCCRKTQNNCNHLIHANCFKDASNNWEPNTCPIDKLKVKTIYLLLEDNQNFDDQDIIDLANSIQDAMNKKVGHVDHEACSDVWRNLRRVFCNRKVVCLIFEFTCVMILLSSLCCFMSAKLSGTEVNLKKLMLGTSPISSPKEFSVRAMLCLLMGYLLHKFGYQNNWQNRFIEATLDAE